MCVCDVFLMEKETERCRYREEGKNAKYGGELCRFCRRLNKLVCIHLLLLGNFALALKKKKDSKQTFQTKLQYSSRFSSVGKGLKKKKKHMSLFMYLFRTRVLRASPSTSSATMTSGLRCWLAISRAGTILCTLEIFFSLRSR